MKYLKLKDERGSVLIGGLMLVFVITLVGVAIFGLAVSEPRLVASRQNREKAVYTADSGVNLAWQQMANGVTNNFDTVWGLAAGSNIVPTGGGTGPAAPSSGGLSFNYQVLKCTSLYPTGCTVAGGLPDPTSQFAVRSTGTVLRTSDNSTAARAVVELIFKRTVQSVFNRGIASTQSSSMSGGGGIIDSFDSSVPNPPSCPTPPCPYDSTKAGTGGDVWSNGSITFQSADTIKGSITAVGNIALDGSHVSGGVWSGGTGGINGGTGSSIGGNATVGSQVVSPGPPPVYAAPANFTGSGTVAGNATAGGTISSTEVVSGTKTQNVSPPPPAPASLTFPPVQDCNEVGTAVGQYHAGDPNRAASGYMTASYVASKLSASGAITVSAGVVKVAGNTVYTESTGVFNESAAVGTLTVTAGSDPTVATFCFNTMTISGSSTLTVSTSVTSAQPVSIYLTDASGKSTLSGGSLANPTHDASRLQIYSSSTDPTKGIVLSGSSDGYMTVYAPGTDVNLSGGSAMYGAVVSKTFEGTGGSDLHYDTALGTSSNCSICPFTWTRVPNTWKVTILQ